MRRRNTPRTRLTADRAVFLAAAFWQHFSTRRLHLSATGDIVYLDPPYQGVTNVRDNRYFSGVAFEEFAQAVSLLDKNNIDYLISYDGECGGKEYGETLPEHLHCERVLLNAGRSSQATLLGKNQTTFEALYISKNLLPVFHESLRKHGGMEARA